MCMHAGERRRKSVRGCIVSSDLSVLNLVIVKKGEQDLPGLTDEEKPRVRGPKRASKIRKMFNLSKVRLAGYWGNGHVAHILHGFRFQALQLVPLPTVHRKLCITQGLALKACACSK